MKRLLLYTLLTLTGHYYSTAQTTIASEGFEANTSTLFTFTGTGQFYSGSTTGTETPSGVAQYVDGSRSRGVQNGRDTIASIPNSLSTQGFTNVSLHFKLASISGTTGNGADAPDSVVVEISTDNGSSFTRYLSIRGNNNARWAYSATGTATTAYPSFTDVATATGGSAGTSLATGPANISVTNLPQNADLRIRIRLRNDNASERWLVDSVRIIGTPSGLPACVAPSSASTLTFPSTTTTTINGAFSQPASGADGYVIFASSSTSATPTLTNGVTYNSGNTPAGYTFVSSGSATTFSLSGLTPNTAYNFFVFAFNDAGCSGGPAYASGLTGTTSTQPIPACVVPGSASNVIVTPSFASASGTFVPPTPAPDSFIIFYGFGTAPPPTLTTGVFYNAGNTPGGYGFVSKDNSSNTSFSITGLTPSTQYTVFVFSYNGVGCTGGPVYAASASATITTSAVTTATYTWNVASGSWSAPASWSPARSTPAVTDVLVFDGATQSGPVATLDFSSGEVISQLVFQNWAAVTFLTSADRTLNIGQGAAGTDLDVQSGSKLTVQGTSSGAGLTLAVVGANTGIIADSVKFAGSSITTQDHKLTANTTAGLTFTSTGSLTLGTNFSSNPFGGNTANSVLFENGSSLVQTAGSNPFVLTAPASLVVFEPASNYYYAPGGSSVPSISGRVFGNFIVRNNTIVNASGIANNVVVNNLLVETGSAFGLTGTGSNTFTVGGNITANGPVSLNAGSGGTVFTAASPIIGGTDRVTLADAVSVTNITIGNTDSIVLNAPMSVTGTLTLNAGRIITGANALTLGASPSVPGTLAYNGGVVEGTFVRYFDAVANAGTTGLFPMSRPGSGERRLLTVEFSAAPATGGSIAATVDSAAIGSINASVLTDGTCPTGFMVSTLANNYITLTAGGGLSGGVYDVTLQHQNPGGVTNPCELAIAKRANSAAPWTIDGVQDFGSGSTSEPIVRHTGLTGFSDFIIAGSQANPLPLTLTQFDAVVDGPTVQLTWTLSNAADLKTLEIERSSDGRVFKQIGTADATDASGNFTDKSPVRGRNYYRIRATDLAGAVTVSGIRTVSLSNQGAATISVFPNPATEHIFLKGQGAMSATLYDAAGRPIREVHATSGAATISLQGVAAGLYLLHATDGNTVVRERIQVVQ